MIPMTCTENRGPATCSRDRYLPGFAGCLLVRMRVAKLPISLGMTVSCLLGYVLILPEAAGPFWLTALSAQLLTGGSASLNNLQDRHMDKELDRTCRRPLPAGHLSPAGAGFQGWLLVLMGLAGLFFSPGSIQAAGLGLAGVVLYNGVYTPMKHRTILAIVPGALCGALPLAMGWAAAGGTRAFPHAGPLLAIMAVMGVWQLPHFWLVLLTHAGDYRRSGRVSMLSLFDTVQLERILLVWVLLFSVMTLAAVLTVPGLTRLAGWGIAVNAMVTSTVFTLSHFLGRWRSGRVRFAVLNCSMLVFMLILIGDRLALG
ncbi:MAG: UbiA family prenyltransferase [Pseudomonadota bacterium]